jgi:hypothetical protein
VLKHYESQTDSEAVAEDEAAFEPPTHTAIPVPVGLVPAVRRLIAKHGASGKTSQPTRKRTARG